MSRAVAILLLIGATLVGCGRVDAGLRASGADPGGGEDGGVAPALDAGSVTVTVDGGADGSVPPAADGGSGTATVDAGVDAGSPDAGTARDAGTATIDCAPSGAARLAWRIAGYQNPSNSYDSYSYSATGDDGLDGIVVEKATEDGHFSGAVYSTFDPDGAVRVPSIASWSCHPVSGCSATTAVAQAGRIVSSTGRARASLDGQLLYEIDPAPAGAVESVYWTARIVATNGTIALFVWDDYRPPASSLVTAVDGQGTRIWQRTFPAAVEAAAVDDSGIALLRFSSGADLVAIDSTGGTLYTQTPGENLRDLRAASGHFHLGGRDVFRVADGSTAATLPFDPAGPAVLTGARLFVPREENGRRWTLASFALDHGDIAWERPLLDELRSFSVTADRTVLIDPEHVLHVVRADGLEVIRCTVAADVTSPMLLRGGRLALARYPNLEVYDLP